MRTISITIWPGAMGSIGQALDVFGCNRVVPVTWNEPVTVAGLTLQEFSLAKEFFGGLGYKVTEGKQMRDKDEIVLS